MIALLIHCHDDVDVGLATSIYFFIYWIDHFYGAIVSPIIIVLITHTMVLYESRSDTNNTVDSTDPFDIDADWFQIEHQHISICFTYPRARLIAKFYLR